MAYADASMCNRYRQMKTKENLSLIFNARPLLDRPEPKTELYPKYPAPIVRKEAGERVLDVMPWGIPLSMPIITSKVVVAPMTSAWRLVVATVASAGNGFSPRRLPPSRD